MPLGDLHNVDYNIFFLKPILNISRCVQYNIMY